MKTPRAFVMMTLLFVVAGCAKDDDDGDAAASSRPTASAKKKGTAPESSATPPATAAAAGVEPAAEDPVADVGTEADFEEEAETTLNTDDIAGELDKIEKAIGK